MSPLLDPKLRADLVSWLQRHLAGATKLRLLDLANAESISSFSLDRSFASEAIALHQLPALHGCHQFALALGHEWPEGWSSSLEAVRLWLPWRVIEPAEVAGTLARLPALRRLGWKFESGGVAHLRRLGAAVAKARHEGGPGLQALAPNALGMSHPSRAPHLQALYLDLECMDAMTLDEWASCFRDMHDHLLELAVVCENCRTRDDATLPAIGMRLATVLPNATVLVCDQSEMSGGAHTRVACTAILELTFAPRAGLNPLRRHVFPGLLEPWHVHPDCRGPLHVAEEGRAARRLQEERERARRESATVSADPGKTIREGQAERLRVLLETASLGTVGASAQASTRPHEGT
jgi:hypothetical protein